MKNPQTQRRHYPTPDVENYLQDDAPRIAEALSMIDSDVDGLNQQMTASDADVHRLQQAVAVPTDTILHYTAGRVSGMTETLPEGQRTTQYRYDDTGKLVAVVVVYLGHQVTTNLTYIADVLTTLHCQTEAEVAV